MKSLSPLDRELLKGSHLVLLAFAYPFQGLASFLAHSRFLIDVHENNFCILFLPILPCPTISLETPTSCPDPELPLCAGLRADPVTGGQRERQGRVTPTPSSFSTAGLVWPSLQRGHFRGYFFIPFPSPLPYPLSIAGSFHSASHHVHLRGHLA